MHVEAGLGVRGRHVTTGATRLVTVEDRLTAFGGRSIEAPFRRSRRRERKLVEVERTELRRHEIGAVADVPVAGFRGDRILLRIVEARIVEGAAPVHLGDRDVGVPVGDRAEARERAEVHSGEPERGRNEGSRGLAVRLHRLSVLVELRVVEAGAPAAQHRPDGRFVDADATIAPTSRSRFGQPSRRRPIPFANESSTVEWQRAQVVPMDVSWPPLLKKPLMPTTAFSFSRVNVTAGSSRFTLPALIAAAVFAGIAVASTLRPSARAVLGLTPGPTPPFLAPAIAWWSRSCPPQNA